MMKDYMDDCQAKVEYEYLEDHQIQNSEEVCSFF